MTNPFTVLVTTVSSEESARKLCDESVSSRLAACAQSEGPIQSTYWWRGIKENAKEWRVVFKTQTALVKKLSELIKSLHPYEIPEIIHWTIDGSKPYLEWIQKETRPGEQS